MFKIEMLIDHRKILKKKIAYYWACAIYHPSKLAYMLNSTKHLVEPLHLKWLIQTIDRSLTFHFHYFEIMDLRECHLPTETVSPVLKDQYNPVMDNIKQG